MNFEPVPEKQGRSEWSAELSEVLRRARRKGDTRPSGQIVQDWLEFRGRFTERGTEQ